MLRVINPAGSNPIDADAALKLGNHPRDRRSCPIERMPCTRHNGRMGSRSASEPEALCQRRMLHDRNQHRRRRRQPRHAELQTSSGVTTLTPKDKKCFALQVTTTRSCACAMPMTTASAMPGSSPPASAFASSHPHGNAIGASRPRILSPWAARRPASHALGAAALLVAPLRSSSATPFSIS